MKKALQQLKWLFFLNISSSLNAICQQHLNLGITGNETNWFQK